MKTKAILLLVLFTSFIVAPTMLSKLYDDIDISMAFVMVEEEEESHNGYSEVKFELASNHTEPIVLYGLELGKMIWEYSLKHDNASAEIFLPPPELF